MTKYQEFLIEFGIVDESKFNEILQSLPKIPNMSGIDLSSEMKIDDLTNVDYIAESLINQILLEYNYVYVKEVDFYKRTFYLYDCLEIEDLYSIKELFKGWTIKNFDEVLESIKYNSDEFSNYIDIIANNATLEQLQDFVHNTLKYD